MSELARRRPAVPAEPDWKELRHHMAAALAAVTQAALAVSAAAAAGDDPAGAAAMVALAAGVLRDLAEPLRRHDVRDAEMDVACDRAVAEDRAAWPRPRRGLHSVG